MDESLCCCSKPLSWWRVGLHPHSQGCKPQLILEQYLHTSSKARMIARKYAVHYGVHVDHHTLDVGEQRRGGRDEAIGTDAQLHSVRWLAIKY